MGNTTTAHGNVHVKSSAKKYKCPYYHRYPDYCNGHCIILYNNVRNSLP